MTRRPHPMNVPLGQRIRERCDVQPDGCWKWNGSVDRKGYGRLMVKLRRVFAHRISYEAFRGPIPHGLVIDHLCRNPPCCNPDHLEAVTRRENTIRGTNPAAIAAKRSACQKGHAYVDGSYLVTAHGCRRCLICTKESNKAIARARKLARAKKSAALIGTVALAALSASCTFCRTHDRACAIASTVAITSFALTLHGHGGSSSGTGPAPEIPGVTTQPFTCDGSNCK